MKRTTFGEDVFKALELLSRVAPAKIEAVVVDLERELPLKLILDDDVERIVLANAALATESDEVKTAVFEVVGGIHSLLQTTNTSVNQLIADISEAYLATVEDEDGQAHTGRKIENLQNNLRLILRVKQVYASTKALTLLNDEERLFLRSKIVTNVRPIFEEDVALPIIGSIITHSLKISVRSNGNNEHYYFALDSRDLLELRDSIDRAISKTNALSKSISSDAGASQFGRLVEINGDE